MKNMKKIASLLLVLLMVVGMMSTTAWAAGNHEVNITGVSGKQEFEAYQIFAGDYYEGVLSNIKWGSGVNLEENAKVKLTVTVDGQEQELEKTATEWADFLAENIDDTDLAKSFAQAISYHLTDDPTSYTKVADGADTATFTGLEDGYYLFKNAEGGVANDESYTQFMLQVVGNLNVPVKADTPESDKSITGVEEKPVEPANYKGVDVNIGDTVEFTLTFKLPENYSAYEKYYIRFNDTMSNGLTFGKITSVKVLEGDEEKQTLASPEDYTAVTPEEGAAGGKLTITIEDLTKAGDFKAGDVVTVVYTVTLNSDAVIGNPGNTNTLTVDFSNDPNESGEGKTGTTPEDKAVVFTFELDGNKVDGNDETPLSGAEFKLQATTGDHAGKWAMVDEKTGKITGWTDDKTQASVVTSDANGNFKFIGLGAGEYDLYETKAPDGYNEVTDPIHLTVTATYRTDAATGQQVVDTLNITITVGEDPTPTPGNTETGAVQIEVENNKGATLPSTGGIGTTIFYAVGGLLAVGAVILLITKRRMNTEE